MFAFHQRSATEGVITRGCDNMGCDKEKVWRSYQTVVNGMPVRYWYSFHIGPFIYRHVSYP